MRAAQRVSVSNTGPRARRVALVLTVLASTMVGWVAPASATEGALGTQGTEEPAAAEAVAPESVEVPAEPEPGDVGDDPTEPADATEQTDTTEPADTTDTTDPTEPTDATEPAEPVEVPETTVPPADEPPAGSPDSDPTTTTTAAPATPTDTTPSTTAPPPKPQRPAPGDPDAPPVLALPAPPAVTVNPSAGLVDMQAIRVRGTGFSTEEEFNVVQCPAGAAPQTCSGGTYDWVYTDGGPSFRLDTYVRRTVRSEATGSVDCASAPGACEIVVSAWWYEIPGPGAPFEPVRIPLGFDPAGPLPAPPGMTVTPDTGLLNNQEVVVEGSGFFPGAWIDLMQCDVAETGCRYFDTGGIIAGSAGTFSTTAALRRRVASWDGDPVDCAVDACVLIASAWSGGSYDKVSAPVSFDPSAPLPPLPTLAVDPSTDLVDHDAVTVTGDGWTPGDWVYVHQCADFGDDYGNCYYSSERYVEVGPDGTFTTEMRLRRMVPRNQWDPGAERFDCASAPGACRIEAVNYDDLIERASTDLVFDPDAPPAPPPTLTVEPATGLADLQVVQVHGEGFLPDDEVMLQQCSAGSDPWGYSGSCRGFEYTAAGDDGTFDMEVVVRRMVGSLATAATDCAVDECVMVARTWWDPYDGATAALGFDPSIPFRTPTVTVTPNVGLEDGQTVTVRGAGFSPNASIGMAQCGGNAASPYDCDLATVAYTNADSGGTFTREFEVSASVANGGAGGDRDCTAPGACVVGAANMSDFGEAGRDWLTFGAPPVLDAGSVEIDEGDHGTTTAVVPVTLSEASGAPVSVRYDATDGSAESPGDYTATGGTLTFAAGETEASIEVEINGDTAVEADETVRVTLSDAAYAAVGGATGIVTILDDDGVVADDDVTILDDDQMVGAESAAPDSGTRSGGTLPYTGGGSQAPLGLGLVVAGAFAVAVGGLRRRRHVGAA